MTPKRRRKNLLRKEVGGEAVVLSKTKGEGAMAAVPMVTEQKERGIWSTTEILKAYMFNAFKHISKSKLHHVWQIKDHCVSYIFMIALSFWD